MLGSVFQFPIFYENEDLDQFSRQFRFVSAISEEEAISKMEEHRKQQVEQGFANFTFGDPVVELDSVIL